MKLSTILIVCALLIVANIVALRWLRTATPVHPLAPLTEALR